MTHTVTRVILPHRALMTIWGLVPRHSSWPPSVLVDCLVSVYSNGRFVEYPELLEFGGDKYGPRSPFLLFDDR